MLGLLSYMKDAFCFDIPRGIFGIMVRYILPHKGISMVNVVYFHVPDTSAWPLSTTVYMNISRMFSHTAIVFHMDAPIDHIQVWKKYTLNDNII